MDLQHLSDVHTGRHAQRVQHDIKGTAIGQKRHILHRKHPGHNTLVSVTACHLIAHGDLSLLGNIDADSLIDSRRQLVTVLPGKYLGIHNDTIFPVGHFQRRIPHFPGLLTEDSSQKPFLRSQFRLALRRNFPHQDIPGSHLCSDADDASLIQIFQGILAYAGNIAGDLLRPQFRVPGFRLILLNMHGSIDIILYQPFA